MDYYYNLILVMFLCIHCLCRYSPFRGRWAIFFSFWFWIHTASETSTAETHTDGGAVIRKPGSAWLLGTPAISIILMFCFMKWWSEWGVGGRLKKSKKNTARAGWPMVRTILRAEVDVIGSQVCWCQETQFSGRWKSTFIWKMLSRRNWKPKDLVWLGLHYFE